MPRIPAVFECDWCGTKESEAAIQRPPGWWSPYTGNYGDVICPDCVVRARAAIDEAERRVRDAVIAERKQREVES